MPDEIKLNYDPRLDGIELDANNCAAVDEKRMLLQTLLARAREKAEPIQERVSDWPLIIKVSDTIRISDLETLIAEMVK